MCANEEAKLARMERVSVTDKGMCRMNRKTESEYPISRDRRNKKDFPDPRVASHIRVIMVTIAEQTKRGTKEEIRLRMMRERVAGDGFHGINFLSTLFH